MKDYKNNKSLTISCTPPSEIGMDFNRLVKQGRAVIQTLAGETGIWTNYNTSDPGITILEHLCYAITDLSYRLSFSMTDLLAPDRDAFLRKAQDDGSLLFPAKEILSVNPLTINDYRKLLIDMPEVKNAWLEVMKSRDDGCSTGLYRVLVEPRDSSLTEEKIKNKLHQHRNLCEDFDEIKILDQKEINIKVSIEIENNTNIESLKDQIYIAVGQEISPEIQFYSLQELLAKGKKIEEIFNGPALEHGFIDDLELKRFDKKEKIYVADIIAAIHKIDQVKIVREITVDDKNSLSIDLDQDKAPSVGKIEVNFYKNGYLCNAETLYKRSKANVKKNNDLSLPVGRYRNLKEYTSVQEDFPGNYLVGKNNVPSSKISWERAAMIKQFKAYLLFFDQILANYFAQADGMKKLFNCVDLSSTYMSQTVDCADIESLLVDDINGYKKALEKISEDPKSAIIRKNKLLDQLLAIFGETFPDYSNLFVRKVDRNNRSPEDLLTRKINHLTKCFDLRDWRLARQNNYEYNGWKLKTRLGNLLGFSAGELDKFYIIEHILLRPFTNEQKDVDFSGVLADPYSCQISLVFSLEMFWEVQKKIEEVINNELPAHVTVHYHWLEPKKMELFKGLYKQWIGGISKDPKAIKNLWNDYSRKIIQLLFNISGIGFMSIKEDEKEADFTTFTVFDDTLSKDSGIGCMIIESEMIIKDGKLAEFKIA